MDGVELVARFGRHVDASSATVFVGAGLSQPMYPGWSTLVAPLTDELGIEPLQDLPQAAQYFVDTVPGGRERLDAHVRTVLGAVGEPPLTPRHVLLAQLPIVELWTTNYDSMIERSLGDPQVFVADQQLAGAIEPDKPRVYKMHGSLEPPGSLVLTRDDYERYPTSHPRFWALLQAQFLTKSFLFLGLSFTDPNLEVVFRLVRLHARESPREHFAVLKRPGTGDQRLFDLRVQDLGRVGVHVLVIEDYAEIEVLLSRLVARTRPSQVMAVGSAPAAAPRVAAGTRYPTEPLPESLLETARAIGVRLAETEVRVVAASEAGAEVGYAMVRQLVHRGAYDSARFTLVRRVQDEALNPPNLRLGEIVFTGQGLTDLRSTVLRQVRCLLVLGGDKGAADEVARAEEGGLGVVPVGRTGGTAAATWTRMADDLDRRRLGGRPIDPRDFGLLLSPDVDAAAGAAVRLTRQGLFLPDGPVV